MAKIENIEANRKSDLAYLAQAYLTFVSCPGGRPIVHGYICPHCGTDPSYGDCGGVRGFAKRELR